MTEESWNSQLLESCDWWISHLSKLKAEDSQLLIYHENIDDELNDLREIRKHALA